MRKRHRGLHMAKRGIAFLMAAALVLAMPSAVSVKAAKKSTKGKPILNVKKKTLYYNHFLINNYKLKIKKNGSKVIVVTDWQTSNKKVVSLSAKKDTSVKLTAKRKGKATITANVKYVPKGSYDIKKVKLKCKVTSKLKKIPKTPTPKPKKTVKPDTVTNSPVTNQPSPTQKVSPVSSVVIEPGEALLGLTEGRNTVALKAYTILENGTKNLTTDVEWSSDNGEVAEVDDAGLVTAVSGGYAYITASVTGIDSSPCAITVDDTKPEISEIKPDGEDTFTVTFTEAVTGIPFVSVTYENRAVPCYSVLEDDKQTVTVKCTNVLSEGQYTITINGLEDLVGNKMDEAVKTVTAGSDSPDEDKTPASIEFAGNKKEVTVPAGEERTIIYVIRNAQGEDITALTGVGKPEVVITEEDDDNQVISKAEPGTGEDAGTLTVQTYDREGSADITLKAASGVEATIKVIVESDAQGDKDLKSITVGEFKPGVNGEPQSAEITLEPADADVDIEKFEADFSEGEGKELVKGEVTFSEDEDGRIYVNITAQANDEDNEIRFKVKYGSIFSEEVTYTSAPDTTPAGIEFVGVEDTWDIPADSKEHTIGYIIYNGYGEDITNRDGVERPAVYVKEDSYNIISGYNADDEIGKLKVTINDISGTVESTLTAELSLYIEFEDAPTIEETITIKVKISANTPDKGKLELNKKSLDLCLGFNNTAVLEATALPAGVESVTWSSDEKDTVASVDDTGLVTAKGVGTAVITATASNGETAVCTVNVTDGKPPVEKNVDPEKEKEITISFNKNGEPVEKTVNFQGIQNIEDEINKFSGNETIDNAWSLFDKMSSIKTEQGICPDIDGDGVKDVITFGEKDADGKISLSFEVGGETNTDKVTIEKSDDGQEISVVSDSGYTITVNKDTQDKVLIRTKEGEAISIERNEGMYEILASNGFTIGKNGN